MTWSISSGISKIAPVAALGLISLLMAPLVVRCHSWICFEQMAELSAKAYCLDQAEQYIEAEQTYRTALKFRAFGRENDKLFACVENDLGSLLIDEHLGADWHPSDDEALALLKNAVEIRNRIYGEPNGLTARTLTSLGRLYQSRGFFEAAESNYKKALEIELKTIGPEDPWTIDTLFHLSSIYIRTGRYTVGETLAKKVLSSECELYGNSNQRTRDTKSELILLYENLSRWKDAIPLLEEELEDEMCLPVSFKRALAENRLGLAYAAGGKHDKAIRHFEEASIIASNLKSGKKEPVFEAAVHSNIGKSHFALGQYSKAEPAFKRAFEMRKELFGEEPYVTCDSITCLALTYKALGLCENAEPLLLKAMQIYSKALLDDGAYPPVRNSSTTKADMEHQLNNATKALLEIDKATNQIRKPIIVPEDLRQ